MKPSNFESVFILLTILCFVMMMTMCPPRPAHASYNSMEVTVEQPTTR